MSSEEGDALIVMLGNTEPDKPYESGNKIVKPNYEDEWKHVSKLAEDGLERLQEFTVHGGLHGSRLRSLVWQLLLKTLPTSPEQWVPTLREQRQNYRLIRHCHAVDPRQSQLTDNPLSQSNNSTWHQYFCDKELRAMIRQDVIRTFPSVHFFRSDSIQCTMINVLFCYAREHPQMCYRQGMHEVLAPLLFVMHCDHQSLLYTQELTQVSAQAVEIMDPTCLEEDVYWLFCSLMSNVMSNYHVGDVTPMLTGHFPTAKTSFRSSDPGQAEVQIEAAKRLKLIREELLSHYDPVLYKHVDSLGIPFQTFGIRWLRVLFGQEFPLTDLLFVWDAIFAEDDNFELVNYIVVSMLVAIRDQLLVDDDTECLLQLMKYPSGVNVQKVVQHALHMRRPQKYDPAFTVAGERNMSGNMLRKGKNQTLSGRFKKFWGNRRGTSPPQLTHGGTKSSLVPKSANSNDQQIERSEGHGEIIDGFTLNDPGVMRAELERCHTLLAFVHTKLERYHTTLLETLPTSGPLEACKAVNGIQELCVLLSQSLPLAPRVVEVETASEAEPAAVPSSQIRTTSNGVPVGVNVSRNNSTKHYRDLKEFKCVKGERPSKTLPLDDPLRELCIDHCEKNWNYHSEYRRHLAVQEQYHNTY